MTTRAECRHAVRMPAAYPAEIRDRRGNRLGCGRTANISENGVFALIDGHRPIRPETQVYLFLKLPSIDTVGVRRRRARTVHYLCRVAHIGALGQLRGVGLHLISKLC